MSAAAALTTLTTLTVLTTSRAGAVGALFVVLCVVIVSPLPADATPPLLKITSQVPPHRGSVRPLSHNRSEGLSTEVIPDAEEAVEGVFDGSSQDHHHHHHHCIHDTPEIQRWYYSGMDLVVPSPPTAALPPAAAAAAAAANRGFSVQSVGSIRFGLQMTDLSNGRYCTSASGVAPDFRGANTSCTSQDDIFTEAKRVMLVENILPAAFALISGILSVQRTTTNIVVPGDCGESTIPEADRSTGLADVDYVLYLSAGKTTGTTLAWAGYCYLETNVQALGKGRPFIGRANFGPANIIWNYTHVDDTSNHKSVRTAVHELLHALGFTKTYMDSSFNTDSATTEVTTARGGAPTMYMLTPKVAETTREFFDCPSIIGAELEYGEGSDGNHWNRRTFYEEIMSPTVGAGSMISNFTLSFFEDTGYYTVNRSAADPMGWGTSAGCGFLTEKCNSTSGGDGQYFCHDVSGDNMCTYDKKAIGTCGVGTYSSSLPSYWQYFLNQPTYGGNSAYMDYCPIVQAFDNRICSEKVYSAPTESDRIFGYYFGDQGRCMEMPDLILNPYTSTGTNKKTRCAKMRCVDGLRIQFQIGGGTGDDGLNTNQTDWIDCPTDGLSGTVIPPASWSGSVICPAAVDVCDAELYYSFPAPATPAPATTPLPPTPAPTAAPPTTASPPSPSPPTPEPTAAPVNCQPAWLLATDSVSPSSVMDVATINQILTAHNEARNLSALTNPAPAKELGMLRWNQELAEYAQNYMDTCPGLVQNSFEARTDVAGFTFIGESLSAGYGGADWEGLAGGKTAVSIWVAEKAQWTYSQVGDEGGCVEGKACGEFIQIVWEETTEVGCGYTYCGDLPYKNYWMCSYGQGGNTQGQYPYAQLASGQTTTPGLSYCELAPPTPAPVTVVSPAPPEASSTSTFVSTTPATTTTAATITTAPLTTTAEAETTTAATSSQVQVVGFSGTFNTEEAAAPTSESQFADLIASKMSASADEIEVTSFNPTSGSYSFRFVGANAGGLTDQAAQMAPSQLGVLTKNTETESNNGTTPDTSDDGDTAWYANYWIWIAGGGSLLLVVGAAIAIKVGKGGGGGKKRRGGRRATNDRGETFEFSSSIDEPMMMAAAPTVLPSAHHHHHVPVGAHGGGAFQEAKGANHFVPDEDEEFAEFYQTISGRPLPTLDGTFKQPSVEPSPFAMDEIKEFDV